MDDALLFAGDPAPHFSVRSTNNDNFYFDTAAGRYLALCFFGSAAGEHPRRALEHMTARRDFFNDVTAAFFGVSTDPSDETSGRVKQVVPGVRYFWDFEKRVSALYGAFGGADEVYRAFTLILDPMLRVIAHIPLVDADSHNAAFDGVVARLTGAAAPVAITQHAPVLILPRVFEPEFCRELIDHYEAHGGGESGFMREVDQKTVRVLDNQFKRRRDFSFDEQAALEPLRAQIRAKVKRRLFPAIHQVFQYKATHMERYTVACYESESQGFFRPHRDNTTRGTAHRRFACTINLNAEAYEGGDLRFPEFGGQRYRAPTGGAVVFSCSLLHEVQPVTRGVRYAFLPFFYDKAAAEIRAQNLAAVTGEVIDKNKPVT